MAPDNIEGTDIVTASQILGLPVETLRKRLQRGRENGFKAPDGTWRVVLDNAVAARPAARAGAAEEDDRLDRLEQDVARLRVLLETLRDDFGLLAKRLVETRETVAELGRQSQPNQVAELASKLVEARIRPTLLDLADMLKKTQPIAPAPVPVPRPAPAAAPVEEPRRRRAGLFTRRDRDTD